MDSGTLRSSPHDSSSDAIRLWPTDFGELSPRQFDKPFDRLTALRDIEGLTVPLG